MSLTNALLLRNESREQGANLGGVLYVMQEMVTIAMVMKCTGGYLY